MISLLRVGRFSFSKSILETSTRGLVSFKDIFGSKENSEVAETSKQNENLIATDFEAIKNTETTRLVRVKAYKPPENVEQLIKNFCQEVFDKNFNDQNFKSLLLSDPGLKFNLLTKCISAFKHNIPNTYLNDIKNVQDLIEYYTTELKDTSPLEDIYQQQDLPKNIHINLEYNRFVPETDKFFNGKDAFPERNTVVTSLWYSKKYKSVNKKKPYFIK